MKSVKSLPHVDLDSFHQFALAAIREDQKATTLKQIVSQWPTGQKKQRSVLEENQQQVPK
jgi:hypothetical protein